MEWNKEWDKEENKDKDNWSLRMQKEEPSCCERRMFVPD